MIDTKTFLFYFTIFSLAILIILFPINIFIKLLLLSILSIPIIYKKLTDYFEEERMEDNFHIFLRDLGEYLKIGQPLVVALKSVKDNDYGKRLNYEIRKLIAEMELGLTFQEALERMAKRVRSKKIKETIYSIIEAEKYGGDISDLLKNLSKSLEDLANIKKERISVLKNFMITYYGIFIGTLFAIFLISIFMKNMLNLSEYSDVFLEFKNIAFILSSLNAVFTGLVIGKVSRGSIITGLPHSIILVIIVILFFGFLI